MAVDGSESGSDEDGNATAPRGGKRPARRRRPSLAVETARFQNPLHSAAGPGAAKGAAFAECPF